MKQHQAYRTNHRWHLYFLTTALLFAIGSGFAYAGEVISNIQVIDLGTLPGGTHSTASDINDDGEIVGTSEMMSGYEHAFIRKNGVMIDIGTLGGDRSEANGINDFGQVVGDSRNSSGDSHGFEWENNVIRDLGGYPPEDPTNSSAKAINNSGLMAGYVESAFSTRGVIWNLLGVPNFNPFPPFINLNQGPGPFVWTSVRDINDVGQATGDSFSQQCFLWQGGVLVPLTFSSGIGFDVANGINNSGQVVGYGKYYTSTAALGERAVLWPDPSTAIPLPSLGGENSHAFDINEDALVVGDSETSTNETVAFVWRSDLGMLSLGTLGGANSKALGVNATGQVVGESETSTGEVHATLWTITIATEVSIDIKPGSDPNCVNINDHGVIPVAILGAEDFDVTQVNLASLSLSGLEVRVRGKGPLCSVGYSNDDSYPDLICHFEDISAKWTSGGSEATLNGELFDGTPITGSDTICVVPKHATSAEALGPPFIFLQMTSFGGSLSYTRRL
ncbi:MAG: hypothetical protein WCH04_18630 [Gammaproteobacteria bacterium]